MTPIPVARLAEDLSHSSRLDRIAHSGADDKGSPIKAASAEKKELAGLRLLTACWRTASFTGQRE
jgi:hypothetical protein